MIRNGRERAKLALSGALIAAGSLFAAPAFAQDNKCTEEATSLRRAESQVAV